MTILERFFPLLLAVTSAAASAPVGPPSPSTPPQLLYSRIEEREAPIWVSVDRVRTADQKIDRSSFSKEESAALDRKLADQARIKATEHPKALTSSQKLGREAVRDDNCAVFETSFYHLADKPREAGLQGLVQSSRDIYVASIAEVSPGFFLGNPASLLRLQITEVLKGGQSAPSASSVLAVYPFARFVIGEAIFCSGIPGTIPRPEVGQHVVAFITSEPLDRQHAASFLGPDQLIAEEKEGTVSLPRALREDRELFPVVSLEETVELIRRALANAPKIWGEIPTGASPRMT